MTHDEVERMKRAFTRWAERETSVSALAIVGSWARGEARDDSDLDVLVLSDRQRSLFLNDAWLRALLADGGFDPIAITPERHGIAASLRARSGASVEIEVTLVPNAWAGTAPVDAGTRRVVRDGTVVLIDRNALLRNLRASVGPP